MSLADYLVRWMATEECRLPRDTRRYSTICGPQFPPVCHRGYRTRIVVAMVPEGRRAMLMMQVRRPFLKAR